MAAIPLHRPGAVRRWAGQEDGFVACTYRPVECLARCGRVEDAVGLFEKIAAQANDLGLLAERIHPATGELRCNFPQAFSHVGLINAARCPARVGRGSPG